MDPGNLAKLSLIFTHQIVNARLGSIFNERELLANSREDDVFRRDIMMEYQCSFSLKEEYISTRWCASKSKKINKI